MEHIDIENLTETEARKLYTTLAMRYGRATGKQTKFSDDELLVWDTINETIGQHRQLGQVLEKAKKPVSAFSEDVEFVMRWVDRGCSQKLSRNQRKALVGEAVQCLVSYVERGAAPLTHKTLIQQLTAIPSALDRAFPGYGDAKMLDRITPVSA